MENILKSIYLFEDLEPLEMIDILGIVKAEHYQQKILIFKERTKGDSFYVIQQGIINVSTQKIPSEKGKVITQLKEGDFFGELGALWNYVRTATISTQTEAYLLKISGQNLKDVMDRNNSIGYKVMSAMSKELASRGQEYKHRILLYEDKCQTLEKKTNLLVKELRKDR